jgi:hypothetical protein
LVDGRDVVDVEVDRDDDDGGDDDEEGAAGMRLAPLAERGEGMVIVDGETVVLLSDDDVASPPPPEATNVSGDDCWVDVGESELKSAFSVSFDLRTPPPSQFTIIIIIIIIN